MDHYVLHNTFIDFNIWFKSKLNCIILMLHNKIDFYFSTMNWSTELFPLHLQGLKLNI